MTIPWWDDRALDAVRRIESGGNDRDVTGSNMGAFQFGPKEWAQWGGGGNVFNRADATAAARREFGSFADYHQRRTGQPMTGAEGYGYHQQGRTGYTALTNNPDALAWRTIRPYYKDDATAQKAIWGNVPTDVRGQFPGGVGNLTSRQFTDMWRDKFNRFAGVGGAPLGVPTAAGPTDLGDPRWGQMPIMAAAREQLPGAIGGLGAGGVRPPEPLAPTRRGHGFTPYTPPPPNVPNDTPMPPLLPQPPPEPFGQADPFGGGPIQLPTPAAQGFGDQAPLPNDLPADATDVVRSPPAPPPPPQPDYAAPGPVIDPRFPQGLSPSMIDPRFNFTNPDKPGEMPAPGISVTPPAPVTPTPPTFAQMGMAPGFAGLPPVDTTSPVQPQPFTMTGPGKSVSGDAPIRPPITDSGPPPSGLPAPQQPGPVADKSLAGMLLGPNVAGSIRGIINNEAFRTGLGSLAFGAEGARAYGGNLVAAQHADIAGRQEARTATTFGQQQADYNRKLAAYNTAFADPENSKLLKPFTPEAREALRAAGPEAAIDFLGKYQLADSEARAKLMRQMEQIDAFKKMAASRAGAASAAPSAGPPIPPDVGGLGRPALMPAATGGAPTLPAQVGVGLSQALRAPAAGPAGPVAAAPGGGPPINPAAAMPQLPPMGGRPTLPQTPGVMPPGMPEPIVNVLGTPMPLSQAEEMAQYLKMTGADTSEIQTAITAAREPQKRYADTMAQKQAEQDIGKPQQRQAISTTLDSIDMTRSLAAKIKNDPNLGNVLGFWAGHTPTWQPGSQDLEANMETLLKRQALDTMARLKQQSATGATGFGSTNDKELGIITGALTNLENKRQTPAQYRQNIDTLVTSLTNAEGRIKAGWRETFKEPFAHPEGYEPTPYPSTPPAPDKPQGRAARAARGLETSPLTHNGRPVINIDGKYVDKEEYERATAR